MTTVRVSVDITREDVEDILWLRFDHHEFDRPDSIRQKTMRRLSDFGMLEERAHLLEAGLAHCYFVSLEEGGEQKLLDYLKRLDEAEDDEASE